MLPGLGSRCNAPNVISLLFFPIKSPNFTGLYIIFIHFTSAKAAKMMIWLYFWKATTFRCPSYIFDMFFPVPPSGTNFWSVSRTFGLIAKLLNLSPRMQLRNRRFKATDDTIGYVIASYFYKNSEIKETPDMGLLLQSEFTGHLTFFNHSTQGASGSSNNHHQVSGSYLAMHHK